MRIKLTLLLALLLSFSFVTFSQVAQSQDKYKRWLERDVLYLITPEEKRVFLTIKNDNERETFVENFWRRRDSNLDTEENEFRDEYYARIAYANEHFQSGIPGWKTDRGKSYIMLGKPDKIETGRATFEGIPNVTFEKWRYAADKDLKELDLVFIDPTESKEFRFLNKSDVEYLRLPVITPKNCFDCIPGINMTPETNPRKTLRP